MWLMACTHSECMTLMTMHAHMHLNTLFLFAMLLEALWGPPADTFGLSFFSSSFDFIVLYWALYFTEIIANLDHFSLCDSFVCGLLVLLYCFAAATVDWSILRLVLWAFV